MKNITLILAIVLMAFGLLGCQKTEQVEEKPELPIPESLSNKAEAIEGDFIYRLVTEKNDYDEGEDVRIYAELEYIGKENEIEITHGSSPFLFPMTETTRNYEIEYAVNLQGVSTILKKGAPMRQEIRGGGGYSDHDKEEYKVFMKNVMKQDYPSGHYVVNGYAGFTLAGNDEKSYTLEAQVEFNVNNEN